mmetsp:Transcript_91028/g.253445  ORF Transcript_91028/g.253445 Transcript_91028/m.253445 type:complete len:95 (-) Transcript_91028:505-789(-)
MAHRRCYPPQPDTETLSFAEAALRPQEPPQSEQMNETAEGRFKHPKRLRVFRKPCTWAGCAPQTLVDRLPANTYPVMAVVNDSASEACRKLTKP